MKGPRGNNDESSEVLFRRALLAALMLALGLPAVVHAKASHGPCIGDPSKVRSIELELPDGGTVSGRYAFPSAEPKGMVVFFHGYGHTADEWAGHLARVAETDEVVTVAMNYHGTDATHTWQVQEGAEDSIRAAKHFDHICGGFPTIVAYGVSMGGNSSGLALADHPTRYKSARPLFDWWFDIEGANNVIETYFEARAVAPTGNATAVSAVTGIENEMGGTFEQVPQSYLAHTNVYRTPDIVTSGIKGVVMVHGVGDGLVPYNQSREMEIALRASGVPVQFWTVGTRADGTEDGTTLDGHASAIVPHDSPFAGHADETSYNHIVGITGFDRLTALFLGTEPTSNGEFVRDGQTGVYTTP